MTFLVKNIRYDTDGFKVKLPSVLRVVVDDEDEIADAISDQTGWCVLSFEPELLP